MQTRRNLNLLGIVRTGKPFFPALALILSVMVGCATVADLKHEPLNAGLSRTFPAELEDVVLATVEAIRQVGLDLESYDEIEENTWMILSSRGTTAGSWGSLVRIVVSQRSEAHTEVRVLTRRRVRGNVTAEDDYSESLFSWIENLLGKGEFGR